MREFSTVDLQRDVTAVTLAAAREPVTITKHKKPRFVLMAFEDYERIMSRPTNPQRAYRMDEAPDEIAELFIPALDAMIAGAPAEASKERKLEPTE